MLKYAVLMIAYAVSGSYHCHNVFYNKFEINYRSSVYIGKIFSHNYHQYVSLISNAYL